MLFAEKIRTAMRESTDRKRIFKHQIARLFKDSLRAFVAVGFNFARSVATGGPTASRTCENRRVSGAGAAPA